MIPNQKKLKNFIGLSYGDDPLQSYPHLIPNKPFPLDRGTLNINLIVDHSKAV